LRGGKKGKKDKMKDEIPLKEAGEEYARVMECYGNCEFLLMCSDGIKRRGKLRGALKIRNVRIFKDDTLLVSLRDFGSPGSMMASASSANNVDKVDIIYKYREDDIPVRIELEEREGF
jgi:initiation factor 1A